MFTAVRAFVAHPRFPTRTEWARIAVVALYVAAVIAFLMGIKQFHNRKTGFTSLINFGDQYYYGTLPAVRAVPHATQVETPGYDGQFYAQLAVEPLLRNRDIDKALDNPPYRARRILFSWTAYLMGLGRTEWILKAYALQNILVWLVLAALLTRWFPPTRARNIVPWIGCMFGAGILGSVRMALNEGPSMMVVALAIFAQERGRSWLATGLMSLSGLGRETNMGGSLLLFDRVPRSLREVAISAGKLMIIALPFLLWTSYVRSLYPDFLYSNPASFDHLLSGYLTRWSVTIDTIRRQGWFGPDAHFGWPTLAGLTVQAVFLAVRWDWKSPWWRMAAPYCLLLLVTSYFVWEGNPGAAPRVLMPITFAFNVLITKLSNRAFWPLAIFGNLTVLSGIYTISS